MAQLIERTDLTLVLGEDISEERFAALYRTALRVVSAAYNGNPEDATGRAAEVVSGVLFGVLVRVLSNPTGARQLSAGPAAVTFGGSDESIAAVFTLTESERADLAAVSATPASTRGAFTIRPRNRS